MIAILPATAPATPLSRSEAVAHGFRAARGRTCLPALLAVVTAACTGTALATGSGSPAEPPASAASPATATIVPAAATQAPTAEALDPWVRRLQAGESVVVAGRRIVARDLLRELYAATDGRPLWRDRRAIAALLVALDDLATDGLDPRDHHREALAGFAALATPSMDERVALDLLATDAFVGALAALKYGKVDPVAIEPTWNVPQRPLTDLGRLEFLQRAIASGRIAQSFDGARPAHPWYARARAALQEYRAIEARGGWQPVPPGARRAPALREGDVDPARVPALRRRLAASGDLVAPTDDAHFDAALTAGVRNFQARHQLMVDGIVGRATLAALNVPVGARIDQIRVNLERARWVLHAVGPGRLVLIDIAGYEVRYLHGTSVVWRGRAIVGRPYRQTPVFRSAIDRVVFNPTWTVPPTILARDVLPGLRRGEDVLGRKGLGVYDRQGRELDPRAIDWTNVPARGFPYVLRQPPGDDNALGRVKIEFPNPYLVYLHDTPTRGLFARELRAFSSGCIRVEEPLELARLVLDDPAWDAAAVQAAVAAGRTRFVRVARPVPVLLMYWTVDEDAAGRVVFRNDPYGRDGPLLRALDAPPPAAAAAPRRAGQTWIPQFQRERPGARDRHQ